MFKDTIIDKEYSIEIGGKKLIAQFTNLTDQANSSVIIRYGNTTVLVTAVMGREKDGQSWFPLSVEFEEKFYAAGAILGGRFKKREGMPSEEAILSGRVIDRTIRPLFDQSMRREIQVVATVLSIDEEDPDVLGIIGASLALGTSDIPWDGPVSAVRVGKINDSDSFIINPSYKDRIAENEKFDILACGKDGNINMIEVGANIVQEDELVSALNEAVDNHNKLQEWQEMIISEIGKPKININKTTIGDDIVELFNNEISNMMDEYVFGNKGAYKLKEIWMDIVKQNIDESSIQDADDYFEEKVDEFVHKQALDNGKRQDGRGMDEIRDLYAQAGGFSEILHGTGIFYRGGTHVFSALTLGGPEDAQLVDTIETQNGSKRYMHYYNFPPYSVGETGRLGGLNRRAIGHGALAEKALLPVIPSKEEFPYTIRIVSETMASNGSSSQASICGSTLSLMDAGVPIKSPVAGIAMGMMSEGQPGTDDFRYKVLTDIQGPEDHFGDMDFKVAGTSEGVTAVQMDVKVDGVPVFVLSEAFEQAKKARLQILGVMKDAIEKPRSELNPRAPKIESIKILEEQIGLVIGKGGETINSIKDETGVDEITIEDDGTVIVTGSGKSVGNAIRKIQQLTYIYKVGEEFRDVKVTKILDFGAFVEIADGVDGLVHISEIAPFRVNDIHKILKEGETVNVVIKEIKDLNGKQKIDLSIKKIDPDFAKRKGITSA